MPADGAGAVRRNVDVAQMKARSQTRPCDAFGALDQIVQWRRQDGHRWLPEYENASFSVVFNTSRRLDRAPSTGAIDGILMPAPAKTSWSPLWIMADVSLRGPYGCR